MITATKTSIDTTNSSVNLSKRNTTVTNLSSKSTSELYNGSYSKKYKSTDSKKDDFKDLLDSKANSKSHDISNVDKYKNDDNAEKLDELKEKSEDKGNVSNDNINELLNSILNLLNKLGIKDESLNKDANSDILKTLLEGMKEVKSDDNDLSNIMNKLLEALKTGSAKDTLDNDSLSIIKNLLSQISENVEDNNGKVGNSIKNLMTEISNMMESKQGDKVLSLEDILKNNLSQNNDGSLNSDSNESSSAEKAKNNSGVSKENKFLNSLLDDKDSNLNRMNLLASKNQNNIQGQIVNSNQETAINKATFANDLIQDVKYMTTNSIKELTVKVNPGNLGEITIKLIQEDGVMKANLKSNSKETTALLSQNLVDIKRQLNDQNIKISDINIELYQDDTTFFKQDGFERNLSQEQGRNQGNNSNRISGTASVLEDDSAIEEVNAKDNSNVNFLA